MNLRSLFKRRPKHISPVAKAIAELLEPRICLAGDLFTAVSTSPAGASPIDIGAADFDEDTRIDLVATNGDTGFTGLPATGSGFFGVPVQNPIQGFARSVAIADFDGDTHLDLAIVNSAANMVQLYRGPSDLAFTTPQSFDVGSNPSAIVGDFNGDSKPDLAVADQGSSSISVLLAGGTQIFLPASNTTLASPPISIAAGDFNGDGKSDLAVVETNGDVAVFFSNGNGTFTFNAPYLQGVGATYVVAKDFNGDTRADLAVALGSQGIIQTLVNDGFGVFSAGQVINFGGTISHVAAGDVNGDTFVNLVAADPTLNHINIMLGTGAAKFIGPYTVNVPGGPNHLALADFTGDGRTDIAVTSPANGAVIVLRQAALAPLNLIPQSINQTPLSLNNALMATFTDPVSGTGVGDYQAKIDWGDGTVQTQATITANTVGGFDINATHIYPAAGDYLATIGLIHTGGRFAQTLTPVHIGSSTLVVAATSVVPTAGQSFTGIVGLIGDPVLTSVASDFTVQINWGDGTAPSAGTVTLLTTGAFQVEGTHTYSSAGTVLYHLMVSHRDGRTGQGDGAAIVSGSSLVAAGTALQTFIGQPISNADIATLIDTTNATTAADFTANINWGDGSSPTAGTVVAAQTGFVIKGSHTYTTPGSFFANIQVTAADTRTTTAQTAILVQSANLTVTPSLVTAYANIPISTTPIAIITDTRTNSIVSDFSVTISWGDSSQSAGTVAQVSQGVFQVFGTHTYVATGTYQYSVDVHHTDGRNISNSGNVVVNDSNLSPVGAVISATASMAQTNVRVATVFDPIMTTTAGNLTAQIDWGDGSPLTAGVIAASASPGGFDIFGDHTYSTAGAFPLHVNITHTDSRTAQAIGQANVTSGHVLAQITLNLNGIVNQPIPPTIFAFTDTQQTVPATYTATIDFGDGTPTVTGSISIIMQGHALAVAAAHTYANIGDFTISVHVAHQQGATLDGTTIAHIRAQDLSATAVNPSAIAGFSATDIPVADITSTLPGITAGDFTAMIDWGDGTNPTAATIVQVGNLFVARGDHTYALAGDFNYSVSIHRSDGSNATANGVTHVTAAALSAVGIPVAGTEDVPLTGVQTATIIDANSNSIPANFTVMIDWGDGTTPTLGTVATTTLGGAFAVRGDHIYASSGQFTVGISVHHTDGRSANAGTTATIATAQITGTPAISNTPSTTISNATIATFTDPIAASTVGDFTATINWGDGTPVTLGTVVSRPNNSFGVLGSHDYANPGDYPIHVDIQHTDGRSTSVDASVTVAAVVAISAEGVNVPALAGVRTAAVRVATFTDATTGTTAADYSADIDWGDGHTSAGTIVRRQDGTFVVRGRNTFRRAGAFNVQVQIHRTSGGDASATSTAHVLHPTRVPLVTSLQLTAANPFSGKVFSFVDANSLSLAKDYSATIDWGDGTSTSGTLRKTGQRFDVIGDHSYSQAGSYTMRVRLTYSQGGTYDANVNVVVA